MSRFADLSEGDIEILENNSKKLKYRKKYTNVVKCFQRMVGIERIKTYDIFIEQPGPSGMIPNSTLNDCTINFYINPVVKSERSRKRKMVIYDSSESSQEVGL